MPCLVQPPADLSLPSFSDPVIADRLRILQHHVAVHEGGWLLISVWPADQRASDAGSQREITRASARLQTMRKQKFPAARHSPPHL